MICLGFLVGTASCVAHGRACLAVCTHECFVVVHFPLPLPRSCPSRHQWARDEFELLFHNNPEEVRQYLSRPGYLDSVKAQRSSALERLGTIHAGLTKDLPK